MEEREGVVVRLGVLITMHVRFRFLHRLTHLQSKPPGLPPPEEEGEEDALLLLLGLPPPLLPPPAYLL
jgi:hypothetical protein